MRTSLTCVQCVILTNMVCSFGDSKVLEWTVEGGNYNFSPGVPLEIVHLVAHGWNPATQRCLLFQGFSLFLLFSFLFLLFLKKIIVKMHWKNIIFYSSLVLVIFICFICLFVFFFFLKNQRKLNMNTCVDVPLRNGCLNVDVDFWALQHMKHIPACQNPLPEPYINCLGRFVHTCNEESDSNFWCLTAYSVWVSRLHLGKLIRKPRCSILWCRGHPHLGSSPCPSP